MEITQSQLQLRIPTEHNQGKAREAGEKGISDQEGEKGTNIVARGKGSWG